MLYFAYGSNMCTARLARRVPQIRPIGAAMLAGHRLYFHLRGGDGSGKCNVLNTGAPADRVYGALFELADDRLDALHAAEGPAYEFVQCPVATARASYTAALYRGYDEWLVESLRPFYWYRAFVVAGAREHGLPSHYIDRLAATPADHDPDRKRARDNAIILDEPPDNVIA